MIIDNNNKEVIEVYTGDDILVTQESKEMFFGEKEDFPEFGAENMFYVATDEEVAYIWKDDEYVPVPKEVDLSLLINNVTYNNDNGVLTFTRGDGSNIEIDLPLEFLVEDGFYDTVTKEIVLILTNETEIRIPVGDLFVGIATEEYVDTKADTKVDKQQDVLDAGKVLAVGQDGMVLPVEQGDGSIDNLTGVEITNAQEDQIFVYDGSNWVNAEPVSSVEMDNTSITLNENDEIQAVKLKGFLSIEEGL